MLIRLTYIHVIFMILFLVPDQSLNAQVNTEEIEKMSQKIEAQNIEIQNLRNQLASETSSLKKQIDNYAPVAMVLFLFGGFCALWAQNTGRNAWSWFFLGLLFSVITVIIVLIRNAEDNRR